MLTESMINQLRLVKRTPVSIAENPANPDVSIIPHKATKPVKASAISSNGFLSIVYPLRQSLIYSEHMQFGNLTYTKRISQEFLDWGLHNDKSTKNLPCENFGLRASVRNKMIIDL